ncbi:MAG: hypothetical protein WCT23_10145 [Candidatus Neomarinimicrobiota bacterium]
MNYKCKVCGKRPDEIEEYIQMAEDMGVSPFQAIHSEEGTLNTKTGLFYCTSCYIKIGMPLGTA